MSSALSVPRVLFWTLVGPVGVAVLVIGWLWRRDERKRAADTTDPNR